LCDEAEGLRVRDDVEDLDVRAVLETAVSDVDIPAGDVARRI
jgi:hypothetical protein